MVTKVDHFLAGWEASILSQAERLLLINAVLSSLPVYAMSAFKLPAKIIEEIDKRRRAFLWTGEDACSGAKCLVAWDLVCKPKERGLGIKDIKLQNEALLLKRLFLLYSSNSAWASWLWEEYKDDSLLKSLPLGPHWSSMQKLIPELQHLTSVQVGDGARTSFWHDCWISKPALANVFMPLYTHALNKDDTVRNVMQRGLVSSLVPRLTVTANLELQRLQAALQSFTLSNEPDKRTYGTKAAPNVTCKQFYEARLLPGIVSPLWDAIWKCKAPLKVKFFAWLLVKDRLSTKKNLHKKTIVPNDICDICNGATETASHLCFFCPFAKSFWDKIGVQPMIQDVAQFHQHKPGSRIPILHYQVFYLLCFWALWNHRHDVVFRGQTPSITSCLQRCIHEAALWAKNLKSEDRYVIQIWKEIFSSPLQSIHSM
ncbi:hypothetical protein OsJ_31478 [Oryza sativa Japonica Group]|uniref:Reverse transcriptase zinc-binding domain-containing protein n=1 Tax=Oryza sativa subsp. japonica TaxID=39947 RepID=B9G5P0_ORYSJ|nr:hypothetical protein OsJ_31478 [Oryza sativa Japonica Group]